MRVPLEQKAAGEGSNVRRETCSGAEMPSRSVPTALLLGTLSCLGACAQPGREAEPVAAPSAAIALCALGHSSIPLQTLSTGHHLADVTVNGKPAKFIVDTGAGRTLIHKAYVEALGLGVASGQQGVAIGAGGATALAQVNVSEFTIASTRTSLDQLFAIDLSHAVKVLDPIVGSPVHGIIGQDILQAQHAIIDVRQERLYLKPLAGERQTGC
jgi:hypothetical protein